MFYYCINYNYFDIYHINLLLYILNNYLFYYIQNRNNNLFLNHLCKMFYLVLMIPFHNIQYYYHHALKKNQRNILYNKNYYFQLCIFHNVEMFLSISLELDSLRCLLFVGAVV
jgi:hypothetical protein